MSPNINERLRLELREFFRQLRQANYSPSFLKFLPKEVRENSLNYLRSLHLPEFETEEVKNDPTGTKLVERLNYHLRAGSRMDKGVFFQSIGLVQKDAEEFVKDQERPIEGKATEQTQEQAEEQKPGTDQQGSTTQQGAGGQTQSKSGFGLPGLAGGTGQTPRQPRIHAVPQVETPEEPKTTLAVANKSGHIVEERTITPTSTKISKPETPNIVLANKSGVVNEGFRGEKILSIANKGGQVVGEKLVKDLESNTQIGIQKGLARAGKGLGEMAKGFGRGIIGPGVSSIYQVGGRVARGGINAGTRLSDEISRSRMRLSGRRKGPSKRIWLLLLGMFFFLMFTSAFAPPGRVGQPGGSGTQNQLTVSKAGPGGCTDCRINIDENIAYTITVIYKGSGTANITVIDKLDPNVSKNHDDVLVTDNGSLSGDIVTWNLSNVPANTPKVITLTVKPIIPQGSSGIWVLNPGAQATITSTSGNGDKRIDNPDGTYTIAPGPDNFVQTMTGKGRKRMF